MTIEAWPTNVSSGVCHAFVLESMVPNSRCAYGARTLITSSGSDGHRTGDATDDSAETGRLLESPGNIAHRLHKSAVEVALLEAALGDLLQFRQDLRRESLLA